MPTQNTPTLCTTKDEIKAFVANAKNQGNKIALVPTMGAIHEGHQSLVRCALGEAQTVVVSVFVNPTQFAPTEDFDAYPKTLDQDIKLLSKAGASAVFAPSVSEMYGEQMSLHIKEHGLTNFDFLSHVVPGSAARLWEGQNRPHHFAGVTTVVSKLFNIVCPDVACFGEKDYQQLAVIQQMVADTDLNVQIVGCPIVRDEDGLAISSRNRYMNEEQRHRALALSRAIRRVKDAYAAGECDPKKLEKLMLQTLEDARLEVDYAAIVDAYTLEPLHDLPLYNLSLHNLPTEKIVYKLSYNTHEIAESDDEDMKILNFAVQNVMKELHNAQVEDKSIANRETIVIKKNNK